MHVKDVILIIITAVRRYILWVASLLARDPGPYEWRKGTDHPSLFPSCGYNVVTNYFKLLLLSVATMMNCTLHCELNNLFSHYLLLSECYIIAIGKEIRTVLNIYIFSTEKSYDSIIRDANSPPNSINIYIIYNTNNSI